MRESSCFIGLGCGHRKFIYAGQKKEKGSKMNQNVVNIIDKDTSAYIIVRRKGPRAVTYRLEAG